MSRRARPALNLPSTVGKDNDDGDDGRPLFLPPRPPAPSTTSSVIGELVGGDTTPTIGIDRVPAPYDPHSNETLDRRERADLATCEQALFGMHKALAIAGKALATINQARLYRETHNTFEEYVEEKWGMDRSYAYRLIRAWPIAAALLPIGHIPEGQLRELLPVAKQHGLPTVVEFYRGLQEQGDRITAVRIRVAARALPPRLERPEQARDVIRVAAAQGRLAPPPPRRPAATHTAPDNGGKEEIIDAEIIDEGPDADEQRDMAAHNAAQALNHHLRKAADAAEDAARHLQEAETATTQGVKPLDHGAAIHDRNRIRRARTALARADNLPL